MLTSGRQNLNAEEDCYYLRQKVVSIRIKASGCLAGAVLIMVDSYDS